MPYTCFLYGENWSHHCAVGLRVAHEARCGSQEKEVSCTLGCFWPLFFMRTIELGENSPHIYEVLQGRAPPDVSPAVRGILPPSAHFARDGGACRAVERTHRG